MFEKYVLRRLKLTHKFGLVFAILAVCLTAQTIYAEAHLKDSLTPVLIISAITLTLTGFMLLAVLNNILPRIDRYSAFAERVADGDLSAHLDVVNRDRIAQLGHSLNRMVDELSTLAGDLSEGAHTVAASATQLRGAIGEQAQDANDQAAAIHQTTSAVEEMRASSDQAAATAAHVAERATASTQTGERGAVAMQQLVDAMDEIRMKVRAISDDINELSQRTSQIEEITHTVADLADQSNLLALNAAIEAARAGESGKGFAVVADEVRSLAEQSKQATTQVQSILGEIQNATLNAVRGAQAGNEVMEHASGAVGQAEAIISELVGANAGSAEGAQQIAASVREQNVGLDQIAEAMTSNSSITDRFVEQLETSKQTAAQLSEVAAQIEQLADRFTLADR